MEIMTDRPNIEATMNEIIQTYDNGITTVKSYLDEAKSKKITVGPSQDIRTLEAIAEEKQRSRVYELSANTTEKVKEIINKYNASEDNFFSLHGEAVTPDLTLLKMDLSESQVKDLQNRYKGNFTMLSSINNYAKNKGYPVLQLQTDRKDILCSFEKLIRPRYAENVTVPQQSKVLFNFLDCAEKYKENFIKQIF